jgi:hypothetical protein
MNCACFLSTIVSKSPSINNILDTSTFLFLSYMWEHVLFLKGHNFWHGTYSLSDIEKGKQAKLSIMNHVGGRTTH